MKFRKSSKTKLKFCQKNRQDCQKPFLRNQRSILTFFLKFLKKLLGFERKVIRILMNTYRWGCRNSKPHSMCPEDHTEEYFFKNMHSSLNLLHFFLENFQQRFFICIIRVQGMFLILKRSFLKNTFNLIFFGLPATFLRTFFEKNSAGLTKLLSSFHEEHFKSTISSRKN